MFGLLDAISKFIAGLGRPSSESGAVYEHRVSEGLAYDTVYEGVVTHVDTSFAWLQGPAGTSVRVHVSEASADFVASLPAHLQVGQRVDFAVLEPGRYEGEYKGSLDLARELQVRQTLASMIVGNDYEVTVTEVLPRRVNVRCGQANGAIPIGELAHGELNDCHSIVSVGQALVVRILGISEPEGWRHDKRQRTASFRASLRATLQVEARMVPVLLRATPFIISARPRLPREMDPVVQFVFEAWAAGLSDEQMSNVTALSMPSLKAIRDLLVRLGLLEVQGKVSYRGGLIASSLERAKALAPANTEGLLLSGVPDGEHLADLSQATAEPPQGLAPPIYDRHRWDAFRRLRVEELAVEPWYTMLEPEKEKIIHQACADTGLRLYIDAAPNRPRHMSVVRQVPASSIHGVLWRQLDSAERIGPPKPPEDTPLLSAICLLECALVEPEPAEQETLYWWEPSTDTWWQARSNAPLKILGGPDAALPPAPPDGPMRISLNHSQSLKPRRWVHVRKKGRR